MEIDRRILLVDDPDGAMQQLALDLVGQDFGVHYANDLDEAQLIAREAAGKIVAVLFSTRLKLDRISDMARRFDVPTAAMIPVGPRPPKRIVAALAFHGVRWHLWDEPPDEAVRFVLSGVLFDHDPFELRYHLRVPTNIPAKIETGGSKTDTTIRDLGLGGACLFSGTVGAKGDLGNLYFEVDGEEIKLPTRVCWTVGDDNPELNVSGVAFMEVDPEAGEAIDRMREAVIERHRIRKPN